LGETPSLSSAIDAVDSQIQDLSQAAKSSNDDNVTEMKLYNKGLKDRQQKADAERIEKERHKEQVQQVLLRIQYENRNARKKKKAAVDVEYDEFLDRPISFAMASRESARKKAADCPFGDECELCVFDDAEPETDSSGQLIDAPSCQGTVVGDSLKAAVAEEEDDGNYGKRGRARRGKRVDKNTRSLLMLQEIKHSLEFVEGYNSGYVRGKRSTG